VFREARALILTPTRELAVQIKEHLHKIIPEEFKSIITTSELIGGMSLQKQERKLGYRPTILLGTPGRVWELLDDRSHEYLVSSLPRSLDVLVLDEADRMVEIGHFKEMNFILDFIYIKREELAQNKNMTEEQKQEKHDVVESMSNNMLRDSKKFKVGKNLETSKNKDLQKLIDEAQDLGEEIEDFDEEDLVMDDEGLEEMENQMTLGKKKKKSNHKEMRVKRKNEEKEEKFVSKMKGIQTIVCSATLTLDSKGRIRPTKKNKKRDIREHFDALEEICKKLKFKQKKPKVINLTENVKMPAKLEETYHRCTNEDKDLYTFYFLQHHQKESTIIFVNSITCIKRLSSMLTILKLSHNILHSKMQQRARLKNFDRFRKQVEALKLEDGKDKLTPILVCTDVAARGLDIPNVDNIVHYQMPVNAEIYVHRCGRTARIGQEGLAFCLFAPEDEKKFKLIYKVLKGRGSLVNLHEEIKPLKVDLVELQRYKSFIEKAKELEKALFDKKKTSIRANWLLKISEETGIPISDDLKKEVQGLEETQKSMQTKREMKLEAEQNIKKKRVKKQEDKKIGSLKKDFHNMKAYKDLAHVSSRSSYLNPTNVKYLNQALFGEGKLNDHEMNKTILVDYLKPDADLNKKRKKGKVRQVKRHSKKRKRTLAKV
jgi:ATP-dependent RNA helicase DDX24/MAK5